MVSLTQGCGSQNTQDTSLPPPSYEDVRQDFMAKPDRNSQITDPSLPSYHDVMHGGFVEIQPGSSRSLNVVLNPQAEETHGSERTTSRFHETIIELIV